MVTISNSKFIHFTKMIIFYIADFLVDSFVFLLIFVFFGLFGYLFGVYIGLLLAIIAYGIVYHFYRKKRFAIKAYLKQRKTLA
jgi:hypothetical protein